MSLVIQRHSLFFISTPVTGSCQCLSNSMINEVSVPAYAYLRIL